MRDDDVKRREIERQLGDRYQIVRTLGEGAFGAVFLAREHQLHRLVAIKVLHADRAWDEDERARLLREARTVANLSHPAVVPLLAYGETSDAVFLVMPYVGGETLADRLAEQERFEPDEVRRILIEVADALAYVHGEGVLHRDLKPENLILERAGAVDDPIPPRVRLIDFGVAAFPMRDLGVKATYETWGTPHFMAPEQMFGEPELDPRSEIYSLGVLGFLLLGGRLPFDATSPTERLAQQRKGPVVALSICAPDAPKDLVAAIEKCLAYEPQERWRRARDIRDTLIRGAAVPTGMLAPFSVVRHRLRPGSAAVERLAARRAAQQPRESMRNRIVRAFSGLDADVRFAVRTLRKAPGFSAAIVATLAIGLGATTVVMSALEALVLRPLPVADPSALVVVQERREGPNQTSNFGSSAFRFDRYLAYREPTASIFSGLASQNFETFSVRLGEQARTAGGLTTSGNYFQVLGVRPTLGTFYTGTVDDPGGENAVVVVGFDFWQRTLGGDSTAVGKTMFVDSKPMTVVGVAPRGFKGAIGSVFAVDVWVPDAAYSTSPSRARDRQGAHWVNIFGRLRPGVSVGGASEALRVIAPRVPTEDPQTHILDAWADPLTAIPKRYLKPVEQYVAMLLAVALTVLLIAAANAAGMLLARATVRRREVATRIAIGASRSRLVRQMLVESLLLCTTAGVIGLALATWLTGFLDRFQPLPVEAAVDFGVNATVLGIVTLIVLGTALAAGLAPALQATAVDLAAAMKEGGLQATPLRSRLRSAFVITQIAMSVVLLAIAGLFVRSLRDTLAVDPGFDATGVISGGIGVGAHGYDAARARVFFAALRERLTARPEIEAASFANNAPLSGSVNAWGARRVGHPDDDVSAQWGAADVGFIELLRTQILVGRAIEAGDVATSTRVAVINEILAHGLWPNEPLPALLGRQFESLGRPMTVVGIMANGKASSLHERAQGYGYVPFAQWFNGSTKLYVRGRAGTAGAMRATREELAALDANVAFERPTALADDVGHLLVRERLGARLIGVFGLVGIVLAMTGLYGVISFGVAQRLREFGVRLALGALPADIVRLVARQGFALAVAGAIIGLAAAALAGRVVARLVFGVPAMDVVTFVVVPLLLLAVALLAVVVPARRGAAADPMTAIRAE